MALSQTKIFPWSFDMQRNVMIIDPRHFEHLHIPNKDNTLTPEQFYEIMHPDDRTAVIDALNHQINGDLIMDPVFYRLRRGDGTWEWFQAQSTYLGQMAKVPYRT